MPSPNTHALKHTLNPLVPLQPCHPCTPLHTPLHTHPCTHPCTRTQAALALYYTHIGGGKLGEAWGQWSWLQAIGFAIFAAGAFLYDKGHQKHEEDAQAAGKAPEYSRWAVLKSTLSMHTGHFVGRRRFRAAGMAVMAGIRARNMANGRADEGDESV